MPATFQEKTAEGNTVGSLLDKQRLVLTAADKILTSFGPDKGYIMQSETGLVSASESVVAHDMISLAWLLLNRESIPESEKDMFSDPYESQFVVYPRQSLGGGSDAGRPHQKRYQHHLGLPGIGRETGNQDENRKPCGPRRRGRTPY